MTLTGRCGTIRSHDGTGDPHRGTVFLSSHILGEVEVLCDRVGILRGGRLVDEGTLQQLRHLAAQTVEVK